MTCCEPAKWKREEIADHKFDYVDVDDFVEDSPMAKFSYSFVFLFTLKSILVYMADLGVLVLLLQSGAVTSLFDSANNSTNINGLPSTPSGNALFCDGTNEPSSSAGQWVKNNPHIIIGVIAASIALSFILLLFEWKKAMAIIRSRDISYAFTSTVAYRYYTIRSFPHYCVFSQIQNSRKTTDIVAFFVFFRFKGWKRLLLAEFPRQFLNAISILVTLDSCTKKDFQNDFLLFRLGKAYGSAMQLSGSEANTKKATLILSTITVTIWIFSAISLLLAFFMYIPLLCTIRGNLKEYCVHKIDKRIGELLRRKSRKRIMEARKAEMKEIEANRRRIGAGGESKTTPPVGLSQRPTLPDIDVDLDSTYSGSYMRKNVTNPPSSYSNINPRSYGEAPYPLQPPPHIVGYTTAPSAYSSHAPSVQQSQTPSQYPRPRVVSEYAYSPAPAAGPYGGSAAHIPSYPIHSDYSGSDYGGEPDPDSHHDNRGISSQYANTNNASVYSLRGRSYIPPSAGTSASHHGNTYAGGAQQPYQPQTTKYDIYAMTPNPGGMANRTHMSTSQPYHPSANRSDSSHGDPPNYGGNYR
ncbi:hypothetical protein BATDEDRAFT_34164 [Batrachochytrium dendrobatidis JAM81]|uniref:Vacuolar membrane protein n=2 Tax=Batrachochytrium dendrobatidis TaxID=109871 RepID=F4NSC2_BATDJ|nr:uncharacterized protein BATDEDRAFT_34164 [Batrachochytrium dendrobatidis JAM81]EGF83407.1 hypothetical protein BATDEDRAFT_34164 [Batrachochytrium dendrobatidis JAM81]KAJ8326887.1 Potassium transporter [Batrachochytrium dendrobatidis]KAK5668314.1 Potassium transporter [Batrachochytrium dendrobatidis]OAJ36950.1 hypothetical protein BDEG_21046 [Batrachochytrium dendrobatidis JEL423]|eukprot:XP_006675771.1 hypothetical protein BATDEDRAFT_34164 [Batrachochytrium dendrobatidis JAM81]